MKKILAVFLSVSLFCVFFGCSADKSNQNAEKFLEIELNSPNEVIFGFLNTLPGDDTENYAEDLENLYKGIVEDQIIPDMFGVACVDFWTLHVEAYRNNAKFKMKTLDISELNESNYNFETTVSVTANSGATNDILLSGSIQVNDSGEVNYARLKGKSWYKDFMNALTDE